MQTWVSKAISLMNGYSKTLADLDNENDQTEKGQLIEKAEAYYMAAISTFLRCFMEQPSTHLKIFDVTKCDKLHQVYNKLKKIRDDEYVHWKGLQSKMAITYSFEVIDDKKCEFAKNIRINFQQSFGPGNSSEILKLFNQTMKFIEDKRNKVLSTVRLKLQNSETFLKTDFLDERGNLIFNKTAVAKN